MHVANPNQTGAISFSNASAERHVKFNIENDFDLPSEKNDSIAEKDSRENDVTITIQPE